MSINAERAARRKAVDASPSFTASNGVSVWINEDGTLETSPAGAEQVQAVREFFVKENDDRLGRWRWPENGSFVVYPKGDGSVLVVSEASGHCVQATRAQADGTNTTLDAAARAYFDAHPEPKPWHDAKPGEGWVIEIGYDDHENFQAVVVSNEGKFLYRDGGSVKPTADIIRSGRRIWPEVQS